MGKWTKEAKNFIKKNVKVLKEKSFLAVFVSSGEASDPEKYLEAKEKYVQKLITDLSLDLNKVMHEAFGGVFDMSSTSRMGRLDKIFSNAAAKEDENITIMICVIGIKSNHLLMKLPQEFFNCRFYFSTNL